MGILQVGFVVMYLSDTLVSGFTTAAAIHILVSQLKFVLGLQVPGISGPLAIIYVITHTFKIFLTCFLHTEIVGNSFFSFFKYRLWRLSSVK